MIWVSRSPPELKSAPSKLGRSASELSRSTSGSDEAADVFAGGVAVGEGENGARFWFREEREGEPLARSMHHAVTQAADAIGILGSTSPVAQHAAGDEDDVTGRIHELSPRTCLIDLKSGLCAANEDGHEREIPMRGEKNVVWRSECGRVVRGS